MDWENKRRDREQGVFIDPEPKEESTETEDSGLNLQAERNAMTDWENPKFRYYL